MRPPSEIGHRTKKKVTYSSYQNNTILKQLSSGHHQRGRERGFEKYVKGERQISQDQKKRKPQPTETCGVDLQPNVLENIARFFFCNRLVSRTQFINYIIVLFQNNGDRRLEKFREIFLKAKISHRIRLW